MKFVNRKPRLPETSMHHIIGHGGMSPKELQKSDRTRHVLEAIIPSVRKQNRAYFQSTKDGYSERTAEYIERVHRGLRNNFDFSEDTTLRIHIAGNRDGNAIKSRGFSELTAYATMNEELGELSSERITWGFFLCNAFTRARHLLYAETSVSGKSGSLDSLAVVDVQSGASYGPEDYKLEGEARLYQTIGHIIDRVEFAVIHDTSRAVVTKLQ